MRVISLNVFLIFGLIAAVVEGQVDHNIPNNLLHCFRSNQTQPWIGNSLKLFLELITKIENANPTSMDIRRLTVNLMHRLRIDGIQRSPKVTETEFVIPFGIKGRMTSKYNILLQLISDTPAKMDFSQFLTEDEICYLHNMISSSVEPFQRGDEQRTCPLTLMSDSSGTPHSWNQNIFQVKYNRSDAIILSKTNTISRCPIEKGVVHTNDYGTISPGLLISAIAAGLEPQTVELKQFLSHQIKNEVFKNHELMNQNSENLIQSKNSIDNRYSAGLAGDLAEVCVFQGPIFGNNSSVGLAGTWNDTLYPRVHYFPQNHQELWDMTNAELLAGLDAHFISHEISAWANRLRTIRLSQVVDMFYSSRGIPTYSIENNHENFQNEREMRFKRYIELVNSRNFRPNENINKACNRKEILELIDIIKLKNETFNFAQLLQQFTATVAVDDIILRRNCDAAVNRFIDYTKIVLDTLPTCSEIQQDTKNFAVDLTLVIDGSRRQYESLQLINYIAEIIDVSTYSSHISVVHGNTGEYLVNRTNSIASAFVQLKQFNGSYPNTISLSNSLASVIRTLSNQTNNEKRNRTVGTTSQVVLIMSQSERINQADFESARRMFEGSLLQFHDLYFVFITNDVATFKQLIQGVQNNNQNDRSEHYSFISSISIDPNSFTKELMNSLKKIPKRITVPYCTNDQRSAISNFVRDEFEEYLTPDVEINYRVNPFYLRNTKQVRFNFVGFGYGDFTVCISRQKTYAPLECKTVIGLESVWFEIESPCTETDCSGIYFAVSMDTSQLRCTENDCRYPDQVRFILRHEGLRCETGDTNKGNIITINVFNLLISSILFYVFF